MRKTLVTFFALFFCCSLILPIDWIQAAVVHFVSRTERCEHACHVPQISQNEQSASHQHDSNKACEGDCGSPLCHCVCCRVPISVFDRLVRLERVDLGFPIEPVDAYRNSYQAQAILAVWRPPTVA